jgi:hypothetical protein
VSLTLEAAAAALRSAGSEVELVSPTSLHVAMGLDDKARDRSVGVVVLPSVAGAPPFVQLVSLLPTPVAEDLVGDLLAAVNDVNTAAALGAFILDGERQLLFRYVLAVPDAGVADLLAWLVPFVGWEAQHFGDYLEGVLEGEISLLVLPQLLLEGS